MTDDTAKFSTDFILRQNKNKLKLLLTAAMLYLIRCKCSSKTGTEQNQSSHLFDVCMFVSKVPTLSKAAKVPKKTLEADSAISAYKVDVDCGLCVREGERKKESMTVGARVCVRK